MAATKRVDMDPRDNIPMEGELNCWTRGFDLPDLILAVCTTKKTGLFRLVSAEAEKTLFLRKGEIIFAKSSSLDDRLGEYLLRQGKISLPELSKLAPMVGPSKRLGTLLVENGLLEPKELVQGVIGQVRTIILSLFRWTEAWYGFNEQELPSKETITLNMPTSQLILDGAKLIDSWRRIAQGVGDMQAVYQRVPGNEEALRSLDLDTTTLEVLAMLGRPQSVEAACATSELPDIDVCRLMWVFRCLGWIEQVEADEAVAVATAPSQGAGESAVVDAVPPAVPTPSQAPEAVQETSFEIVQGNPLAAGSPAGDGAGEETGAPVSASLADLEVVSLESPGETAQDTEASSGDAPHSSGAYPPAGALDEAEPGETVALEGLEPETPGEDSEPIIEGIESPLSATPEETQPQAPAESKKETTKAPVLETEDMDFEGLGMVFGGDDKK